MKEIIGGVSFLIKLQFESCHLIKKEITTLRFSHEFCEIFKITFFIEHLLWLLLMLETKPYFNYK